MFGYTLLVIMIIFLICVAIYFYCDWLIIKEIVQEDKERNIIENRLTESLKTLCAQLGIDLSYHKELGNAAGRILYHSINGRFFVDDARIEILEKYKSEPYTLAHELGHYMAIKKRQDTSEEGADREADELCRLILNKQEQKLLAIPLNVMFHTV